MTCSRTCAACARWPRASRRSRTRPARRAAAAASPRRPPAAPPPGPAPAPARPPPARARGRPRAGRGSVADAAVDGRAARAGSRQALPAHARGLADVPGAYSADDQGLPHPDAAQRRRARHRGAATCAARRRKETPASCTSTSARPATATSWSSRTTARASRPDSLKAAAVRKQLITEEEAVAHGYALDDGAHLPPGLLHPG